MLGEGVHEVLLVDWVPAVGQEGGGRVCQCCWHGFLGHVAVDPDADEHPRAPGGVLEEFGQEPADLCAGDEDVVGGFECYLGLRGCAGEELCDDFLASCSQACAERCAPVREGGCAGCVWSGEGDGHPEAAEGAVPGATELAHAPGLGSCDQEDGG